MILDLGELCYEATSGKLRDAEIHEAILAEGDEALVLTATRKRLIDRGEDPELVARLYPDPETAAKSGVAAAAEAAASCASDDRRPR